MNKRKILEWIHRIIGFTIFQSLITVIGFVAIYTPIKVLTETNNINFGTSAGLLQASLAVAYLQAVNVFYWIMGINLFDFKKLWRLKKNEKESRKDNNEM